MRKFLIAAAVVAALITMSALIVAWTVFKLVVLPFVLVGAVVTASIAAAIAAKSLWKKLSKPTAVPTVPTIHAIEVNMVKPIVTPAEPKISATVQPLYVAKLKAIDAKQFVIDTPKLKPVPVPIPMKPVPTIKKRETKKRTVHNRI